MLKQSLHCKVKIGDGWVGRSTNGPKIEYPLWMAPYVINIPSFLRLTLKMHKINLRCRSAWLKLLQYSSKFEDFASVMPR